MKRSHYTMAVPQQNIQSNMCKKQRQIGSFTKDNYHRQLEKSSLHMSLQGIDKSFQNLSKSNLDIFERHDFIDNIGVWMFSVSDRYYLDASGGILNQPAVSSATIFSAFSGSASLPELSSVSATDAPGSEVSLPV